MSNQPNPSFADLLWKIYRRPVAACASGIACIAPQRDQIYRTVFWVVAAAVIALLAVPYYLPLFY